MHKLVCDKCGEEEVRVEIKPSDHSDGIATGRVVYGVVIHDNRMIEGADCWHGDWCNECLGLHVNQSKWDEHSEGTGLWSCFKGVPPDLYNVIRSWAKGSMS